MHCIAVSGGRGNFSGLFLTLESIKSVYWPSEAFPWAQRVVTCSSDPRMSSAVGFLLQITVESCRLLQHWGSCWRVFLPVWTFHLQLALGWGLSQCSILIPGRFSTETCKMPWIGLVQFKIILFCIFIFFFLPDLLLDWNLSYWK